MQHPLPRRHLDRLVAPHRPLGRLVPSRRHLDRLVSPRRHLGRLVSPHRQGRPGWHRDCRHWSAADRRKRSHQLVPL